MRGNGDEAGRRAADDTGRADRKRASLQQTPDVSCYGLVV